MSQEESKVSSTHPVFQNKEASDFIYATLRMPSYHPNVPLWIKMGETVFYLGKFTVDDFKQTSFRSANAPEGNLVAFLDYLESKGYQFSHFLHTLKCHGLENRAQTIRTYLAQIPVERGPKATVFDLVSQMSKHPIKQHLSPICSALRAYSIVDPSKPIWACIGSESFPYFFEDDFMKYGNLDVVSFLTALYCLQNQGETPYTLAMLARDLNKHGQSAVAKLIEPYT